MANFGRKSANQFNSTVKGQIGSGVNAFQQLHLYVDTQNKKNLTHVSAAAVDNTFPVDTGQNIFRLIICSGTIQPNDESITILDMSPFFPDLKLPGLSRLYYDEVIRDRAELDFNSPIIVPEGEQLNVLMSLSWQSGDGSVSPSGAVGFLSMQGFEGDNQTQEFPYRLR